MIWAFLPIAAGYAVFAWLLAQLGYSIVGESRSGKAAVPIVAAAWPLAIVFLVIVGVVAAIDAAFERATAWMRNPEELL